MKNYQFKTILFEYFCEKILEKFPILNEKIYQKNLLLRRPDYPFLVLEQNSRKRLNKRLDTYSEGENFYIKNNYQATFSFSVHTLFADKNFAENFAEEVIDFVEEFFLFNQTTHIDLLTRGIVVNELLDGEVFDESRCENADHEFVKTIKIVFEYEDLREIQSEEGKDLTINIDAKD